MDLYLSNKGVYMFQKKEGAKLSADSKPKAASPSKSDGSKMPIGNVVAAKKLEDGSYERQDVLVIFQQDDGSVRFVGKRGTDFEEFSFFINIGTKDNRKHLVVAG
jgi:hypothetical protein